MSSEIHFCFSRFKFICGLLLAAASAGGGFMAPGELAKSFYFLSIILGLSAEGVWAQSFAFEANPSVSIPSSVTKKPASDLLDASGNPLDPGQAASLVGQGVDLSTLNPKDNLFWQNRSYSASDADQRSYPSSKVGVRFLSFEAEIRTSAAMLRVQSLENPKLFFRMSLSRYTHGTLMRAALLRKLGYFLPSPKHYRDLRVQFADAEEKKIFLESVQNTLAVDFESRGWIRSDNSQDHSLVLSSAILEPAQEEYFDIHWGFAPNPDDPDQLPLVQRYSRFRAYRALLMPYVLVDFPESMNRFSPKLGSILSGFVVFNHPSANSFSAAAIEDLRWLFRRLGKLKFEDFKEIVEIADFPKELKELALAKLTHRVKNGFELLEMKPDVILPETNLKISSPSGLVKEGTVEAEFFEGYPFRYSHGQRESPFEDGDFNRYLKIRGKSVALGYALSELNKKLMVLGAEQILADRRETLQQRIIEHIRNNPRAPFNQPVEAWGGPVMGFNVSANRVVAAGTYYGSTAAVQLVDNLSVGAALGWVATLEGIPQVKPNLGANLSFQRDFTHVRPILSLEMANKFSWKDVVIPHFMKDISQVLKGTDLVAGSKPEDPSRHPLDVFLTNLAEGEVFTITDSVTLSGNVKANAGLDALGGFSPFSVVASIGIGADATRVTLKQTSFIKTSQGIQVFVRSQNSKILGMTLDVNYFINLLKIRAQKQKSHILSDAFVIDYNPAESALYLEGDPENLPEEGLKFIEKRDKLRRSLLALFRTHDPEMLYGSFPFQKFDIEHKLNTKQTSAKFLWMRAQKFSEDHWLEIKYPRSEANPDLDPEKEKITLYRNRKGELFGRDILGLVTEGLEAGISQSGNNVSLGSPADPNPANVPFGKAYWRMVTTEGDLTPVLESGREPWPSVSVLTHVWGGWNLKRDSFLKLLDEIQDPMTQSGLYSYRLIEKEAFLQVKSIDFYRITQQLSLLPGGVQKIQDLLLQPETQGQIKDENGIKGFFQRLSEKLGGASARAGDREMFNTLMGILGNGDPAAGRKKFNKQCKLDQTRDRGGVPTTPGYWVNGVYYECLVPWVNQLLHKAAHFPGDKAAQIQWTNEVLFILDQQIPWPQLLKYLGPQNFIFFVRINGFRSGDEDGDLEYFSNSVGDPAENSEYANGLVNMLAQKTRISPVELDRSQGGFR